MLGKATTLAVFDGVDMDDDVDVVRCKDEECKDVKISRNPGGVWTGVSYIVIIKLTVPMRKKNTHTHALSSR